MKTKSQSGLSLIEVLVAAGVMAGLALAMGEMMLNNSKAQKGAAQNSDFLGLANQIQIALSSTSSCTKALQSQTMDPVLTSTSAVKNSVLINGPSGPQFSPSQIVGGLKLTSLNLLVKSNTLPVTTGNLTEYQAELQITADKVGGASFGSPTKNTSIPLKVAIDPSKKIVSCSGTGGVIATCPAGRFLASDGAGGLQCSAANLPNCQAGQALVSDGIGGFSCANFPQVPPPPSCGSTPSGGTVTRNCTISDAACPCGRPNSVNGSISQTCVYGVWLPEQRGCIPDCPPCQSPVDGGA